MRRCGTESSTRQARNQVDRLRRRLAAGRHSARGGPSRFNSRSSVARRPAATRPSSRSIAHRAIRSSRSASACAFNDQQMDAPAAARALDLVFTITEIRNGKVVERRAFSDDTDRDYGLLRVAAAGPSAFSQGRSLATRELRCQPVHRNTLGGRGSPAFRPSGALGYAIQSAGPYHFANPIRSRAGGTSHGDNASTSRQ